MRLHENLIYRDLYSLSDKSHFGLYEQELFALSQTGNICITISFLLVKFYPSQSKIA